MLGSYVHIFLREKNIFTRAKNDIWFLNFLCDSYNIYKHNILGAIIGSYLRKLSYQS